MDEQKLISLVQSNEHLYNKFARDYKRVYKKNKAWSKIAHAMGQSADICRKRWTSLRDRYVREKRLGNKESDRCSSSLYSFPHRKALKFLDEYITPRPNRRSRYVDEHNVSLPYIVELPPDPIDSSPCYTVLSSPNQQSPNSEPDTILTKKIISPEPIEPYKIWSEALETFKDVCKSREEIFNKEEREEFQDEVLYSFEKMILGTIGSLSITKQATAMQQVTDVVMKIKMETQIKLDEIVSELVTD